MNNAPSLGHFLEAERKAATNYRRSPSPGAYEPGQDDFSHVVDPNSLFDGGIIAPPQSRALLDSNGERAFNRDLLSHENAEEPPLLLSCLCGHLTNS